MIKKSLILLGFFASCVPACAETSSEVQTFRGRIDKALLEAGISMSVSIRNEKQTGSLAWNPPLPSLIFYGYLDRASVYQIVNKLMPAFEEPRKIGIKTVEFVTTGARLHYVFDLRKPSQVCSVDLCF